MSLAGAFEDHLSAVWARGEVVAGDGIPSKTPVNGESSGLAFSKQGGVFRGQGASPTIGTLVAKIAQDGEVGISTARETYFGRSARVATATPREHRRKRLLLKGEDDSFCLARSNSRGAVWSGRFAEELTMSEIAKIKVAVTPSSCQEVGTCDHCLSFQGFGWHIRAGLGGDSGGDRGFQIHGDDGNHFSVRGLHNKSAAISARDLSGNSKKKRNCAIVAGRCVEFRGSKNMAAEIEEQRVIGNMNRGNTRTWLENECLACGMNDDGFVA